MPDSDPRPTRLPCEHRGFRIAYLPAEQRIEARPTGDGVPMPLGKTRLLTRVSPQPADSWTPEDEQLRLELEVKLRDTLDQIDEWLDTRPGVAEPEPELPPAEAVQADPEEGVRSLPPLPDGARMPVFHQHAQDEAEDGTQPSAQSTRIGAVNAPMLLWQWLTVYVVAPSRSRAWRVLVDRYGEAGQMDDAMLPRVGRGPVAAAEDYLHALDPEEAVDVPSWAVPDGALLPQGALAEPTAVYSLAMSASGWAQVLPSGTILDCTVWP